MVGLTADVQRNLVDRLTVRALRFALDRQTPAELAVEHLLKVAGTNRVAVQRAIARLSDGSTGDAGVTGRAVALLRMTLASGDWAWRPAVDVPA